MDANSKLGSVINPTDPHAHSKNGKLLLEIFNTNDWTGNVTRFLHLKQCILFGQK